MSDSVWSHRRQPTRLPHPWDSLGKNTGMGCHFLLQCMKVKSQSDVTQSCPTLSDPMDCSLPGPSNLVQFSPVTQLCPTLCNQTRQHIKKQRHYFNKKGPYSQSHGFTSSHVWMWELDYKESWALKNWCFWTAVLEKILESPLDSKEIQPVHPKGDNSWIFLGRTDAEAETPILWPPDVKNWLIGRDPDDGKVWRQEEKGMIEDEMVGWHHWCEGHEFE